MTLGLDLSDGAARAVIVDEHAQVLARAEHAVGSGTVAQAARASAINMVTRGFGRPGSVTNA